MSINLTSRETAREDAASTENRPPSSRFGPDGATRSSGSDDGTVRLRDTATGEELVGLPGRSSSDYSLAFGPKGKTLVSSSGDNTLSLWDTEPLRARYRLRRAAEVPGRTRCDSSAGLARWLPKLPKPRVAHRGLIDLRAQAQTASVLRSDTPEQVRVKVESAED